MVLRCFAAFCLSLGLLCAKPALAQAPRIWSPQTLASAIGRQASATSFAELERFADRALQTHPPDQLERLEHVSWLLLNQSDFQAFGHWNAVLATEAFRAGNHRYIEVARIDALRSRYDQGDLTVQATLAAIAAHEPDSVARVHAMVVGAYMLVRQGKAAAALKLLSEADAVAIAAGSAPARAGVWEIEGLALMQLKDLDGSALAFGRSQFEFGRSDYPRPDFDGIWDMAILAVSLGRSDLAQTLYAQEHRLAARSTLPNLRIWDQDLCALVAESRDAPSTVLDCLKSLGPDMKGAGFIAPRTLPARAIAYARLGRVGEAEQDLQRLRTLQASKAAESVSLDRIPEVEAAVLHAEGRDREAFETLRRYSKDHEVALVQTISAGVGQLTAEMGKQINIRRIQLDTAQKNLALAHEVVADQRLLGLGSGLIGLVLASLFIWQVRVARQLKNARIAAEAASHAKGEFLANMSHEIRTPLNGILTMAQVMEHGLLDAEQRHLLSIVRQSGQDLLHLLNDILDFSKIEAGKLELEKAEFDPETVLESTLAGFAAQAEKKDLQLWLDIAPEARGLRRGDPARLRQIVCNFVSNALKCTAHGGVRIIITGLGESGREGLQLAVNDTGLGIPVDKMALLFQKFSQVDASTTRRFGGTGLGLAICQELANLMGGQVWAESVEGQGSTFYATLKLPYLGEAPAVLDNDAEVEALGGPVRGLRLLAAEDNATNQVVLSTVMQVFGFDLTLVDNGAQALATWREQEFDLILMDVQMPVMDGVQATRAIRAEEAATGRSRTPIIALSANAFHHQITEYLDVGMDTHVAKPIDLSALQAALEAVLAQADQAPNGLSETPSTRLARAG